MEPSTQKINVSEKVDEMDELLEQGNVREAATLAIATLSSVDDDKVFIFFFYLYLETSPPIEQNFRTLFSCKG